MFDLILSLVTFFSVTLDPETGHRDEPVTRHFPYIDPTG